MSYVDIAKALTKRLALYSPSTPKGAPGLAIEPKGDEAFITSTLISTNSSNSSFGDGVYTLEQGVFRISCYYPHGLGASGLLQMTDEVRNHFFPTNGRGLALSQGVALVRIERKPEISTIYEPNEYYKAHISQDVDVRFYCHISPV